MKRWQQHLTTRLSGYFLLLSLVSVSITGGVTFYRAQASLQKSAFNQLSVAATLKENEISRWFEDQQRIFLSVAHLPIVQSQSRVLLDIKTGRAEQSAAHALLVQYLTSIDADRGSFTEVSILDRSDHIIASTNSTREGQYESSADLTYFEEVKPGEPTTPIFYTSPPSNQLLVTLATPIRSATGNRIGVIAIHLNLDRLSQIVKAQPSLGQAVDSYLVGSVGTTNTLVSETLSNAVGQAVSSVGIDAAMRGLNGSGLYQNYAQIPVIGVYQSLSNLGLSLLVEQHQDIANQPAQQLAQQITLLGLVSAGVLALGLYGLARRIADPILKIAHTATRVAAGDLDQKAPVLTEDEVGLLARNFNNMVEQLKLSRDKSELYSRSLEQKAQELQIALQELKSTQAQLVQSEKMSSLGQLVAGVAHEINNPVNFIYGNLNYAGAYTQDLIRLLQLYQQHCPQPDAVQAEAEAIDLDFLMEDLPKLLTSMKVGADRIREIVLSLRNFSRMDEAEMKVVDIHEGIDSTLLILQNRLKAKQNYRAIEVIKHYGDLPLVECYAGQLNQVFMNILSNALDALEECGQQRQKTQQPSQIHIYTEKRSSNQVRIRIVDNGVGMTETVCQRLFDPFFTTKSVGSGTGLGLSISYQIVTKKHGGSLQCVSAPGQGAEFIIEIPVQQI